MKLNYRDKVILAIVLAIALMVAGFLSLIKPQRANVKSNEKKLSKLEDEKDEIDQKIARTDGIIKKINTSYENADKQANLFVEKEKVSTPVLLDTLMGDYADKNEVKIVELKLDDTAVKTLEYYYKEYKEASTTLLQASDINDQLQTEYNKNNKETDLLKARNKESVLSTRYGLDIVGEKEKIYSYLRDIKDIDGAVLVTSFGMEKYDEDEKNEENQDDKNKDKAKEREEKSLEKDDVVVKATIVIDIYSVYKMPKPITD